MEIFTDKYTTISRDFHTKSDPEKHRKKTHEDQLYIEQITDRELKAPIKKHSTRKRYQMIKRLPTETMK